MSKISLRCSAWVEVPAAELFFDYVPRPTETGWGIELSPLSEPRIISGLEYLQLDDNSRQFCTLRLTKVSFESSSDENAPLTGLSKNVYINC